MNSIAEQSTRYCNYTKGKFGSEITYCLPAWLDWKEQVINKGDFEKSGSGSFDSGAWINCLLKAESTYKYLISQGWQPQQAREVLPLCTATEICHTAFASDWKRLINLRYFEKTGKVHPNMKDLMQKLVNEAQNTYLPNGTSVWEDIINKEI